MKIKQKITLAFLLLSMATLVTTSVFSYLIARGTITRQALGQLQSVADIQHSRVQAEIDKHAERLTIFRNRVQAAPKSIALIVGAPGASAQNARLALFAFKRSSAEYSFASFLNLEGVVVASSNPNLMGYNNSGEKYFQNGLNGLDAGIIDDPELNKHGRPTGYVSAPIRQNAKVVGVAVAGFDMAAILDYAGDSIGAGKTGETLLFRLDAQGDPSPINKPQLAGEAETGKKPAYLATAMAGKSKTFSRTKDYRDEDVLAATRFIDTANWGMVVKVDRSEALALIPQLRNLLLSVIAFAAILITFVSFMLARSITNPIIVLTKAASRIKNGDLSQKVVIKTKDEIATLSESINEMTDHLISSNNRLKKISIEDALTGLYNRRYFMENLEVEVERAARYKTGLVLCIFDLDYFKQVNDTYGHQAGDMILREVGGMLRENARMSDMKCRYGGEEFAVILPSTDTQAAHLACERFRQKLENTVFSYQGSEFKMTISIGIASLDQTKALNSVEELVNLADTALYLAKAQGRNRTCIAGAGGPAKS